MLFQFIHFLWFCEYVRRLTTIINHWRVDASVKKPLGLVVLCLLWCAFVCFYLYENVCSYTMLCENQTTHRSRQANANTRQAASSVRREKSILKNQSFPCIFHEHEMYNSTRDREEKMKLIERNVPFRSSMCGLSSDNGRCRRFGRC